MTMSLGYQLEPYLCQLLSAVENPTSTTALIRSPYSMVRKSSLKENEDTQHHRGDFTHPKPNHANSALVALVATRPYVSIIGKIPEVTIDSMKARQALILC